MDKSSERRKIGINWEAVPNICNTFTKRRGTNRATRMLFIYFIRVPTGYVCGKIMNKWINLIVKSHNVVASEVLKQQIREDTVKPSCLSGTLISKYAWRPIILRQFVRHTCSDWTQDQLITVPGFARSAPMTSLKRAQWPSGTRSRNVWVVVEM